MAETDIAAESGWRSGPGRRPFLIAGVALALVLTIAAFVAWRIIAEQRVRDVEAWQVRLSLIADGRAAAINEWLDRQYGELDGLAENTTVQLFLSELAAANGDAAQLTDGAAQESYLRNLLTVTAQRGNFALPPAPAVNANVRRAGGAGLLILDADRKPLIGTPDMPPFEGALQSWALAAPAGKRALLDLFLAADGAPSMAFLVPVASVEGGPGAPLVGYVLGLKEVAGELFPLLRPPGPPEPGAETLLVRPAGAAIEFLSPLADGTAPLQRRLAADTPDLAAAFAMTHPGGFAVQRDDRGDAVLVTGRAMPTTGWTLVHTVQRDIALGDSDARRTRLLLLFALVLAGIAGGFAAVWYYASSHRAGAAAAMFEALARRLEHQTQLLRLVTNSQPNAVFITDAAGRYRFANLETERRAGLAEADLVGKTMEQVLGTAAAERYRRGNDEALAAGARVDATHRVVAAEETRVVRTAHVPLPEGPDRPQSILVVEEDLTSLIRERERRERTLQELLRAMTAAVDRRDHFAADQSARVAMVARAVAEEMELDATLAETTETAGNLVNFGKLLVPSEILNKAARLSEAELSLIRSSLEATADFLAGIEFDGPVIPTLREMQERWDGSGPHGLAGEAIPLTARIVAVANAFVAIASPRAWRPGSDVDTAMNALLQQIGTSFDRRVVAALVSWLDNHGGRARWAAMGSSREAAPGAA